MILRRTACLAVLLAVPALAQGAKKPEAAFWDWFAKDEVKLAEAAQKDPVAPMNEISDTLERLVQKGLIAELAVDATPGAKSTVVISADGDKQLFARVKAVVAAAPALKRWKVVAFRQRRSPDETLELGGKAYTVADFSFREVARGGGRVDVEIYVRGMKAKNDRDFMQVTFILLDGIVGEYDMESKVGAIALLPLSEKPAKGLRPLKELAAVVDSL